MKHLILTGLLVLLCSLSVSAQSSNIDSQVRLMFHPTVDISKHWFATGWLLANEPNGDNWSLRAGIGYRREKWALEAMYKQQFSGKKRTTSAVDFRFTRPLPGKLALFAEATPNFNGKSIYDMVTLERKVARFASIGGETENIHRAGRDSIGVGPAMSLWKQTGTTKVVLRAAYQYHPHEHSIFRIYLIVHLKFPKVL